MDLQNLSSRTLQKSRTWIISHPEYLLTGPEEKKLDLLLNELLNGTPLAYVLGTWEFFSLEFFVNQNVLIPRPETEMLVEMALDWLKNQSRPVYGIDIGTGSACIPVSLALNHSALNLTASDISAEALKIARRNVSRYKLERKIHLVQGDLLGAFITRFDLICANLPYIPTHDLKHLDVSRKEPLLALDGGEDGLFLIRKLLKTDVILFCRKRPGLVGNRGKSR